MTETPPAYGLWTLVVINSAVFILFAFSFFKPQTKRDWRSFGAFSAFLVALFTEMYGFPLTIYLLSGWLQSRYPEVEWFSHDAGHLLEELFGWRANPHFGPFHLLSFVLIGGGFILISAGWRALYEAQRRRALATTGVYGYVRHPQYVGFVLVMLGVHCLFDTYANMPAVLLIGIVPVAWLDATSDRRMGIPAVSERGRTLIARAAGVNAHRDVGRLLVQVRLHLAGVGREADRRIDVADLANGVAGEPVGDLQGQRGGRGDLAGDDTQVGGHERFAGDATERVVLQAEIEDGVGDLIGHLVGVTMDHGRALADHDAVNDRDEHHVAGLRHIGGEPVRLHRLVEDIDRHTVEQRSVIRPQPDDVDRLHAGHGLIRKPVPAFRDHAPSQGRLSCHDTP